MELKIARISNVDGPIKNKINWPKELDGEFGNVNGEIEINAAPIITNKIPIFFIFSGFLVIDNIIPNKQIASGNQNKSSAPGSEAIANMYRGESYINSN